MRVSLDEIRTALNLTCGINGVDETACERRARLLYDDVAAINLKEFKIERPVTGIPLPLVEYTFGDNRRSIDNARNPKAVKRSISEMDGTGVDREDIQYFAKVCEIGHKLIPHLWPMAKILRNALRQSATHLDTLNEVWWLARWDGINWNATKNEHPMRRNETASRFRRKKVDWRLESHDGWAINLEVKNFARANADRVYGKSPSFYRADGLTNKGELDLEDPRLKFGQSSRKEINVLAVTWYDEISSDLESWVESFLDASTFPSVASNELFGDRIDAVLIWSHPDKRRNGWRKFFPRFRDLSEKRNALMRLLAEPDYEDHNRQLHHRFAMSIEDVQREPNRIVPANF